MQRLLEILLGLKPGFLAQEGHVSIQFNPTWPWQQYIGGAALWNLALIAAGIALIVYVYRREGKSRGARIFLGILRGSLLALILVLLNRPLLTLSQMHRDPSVVAILVDDSASMKIKDVPETDGQSHSRLDAVKDLLNNGLLRRLSAVHDIRLYDFSRGPHAISDVADLQPIGQETQVTTSVRSVLEDLQGQRLAGVVIFSDGRETPASARATRCRPSKHSASKSIPFRSAPIKCRAISPSNPSTSSPPLSSTT